VSVRGKVGVDRVNVRVCACESEKVSACVYVCTCVRVYVCVRECVSGRECQHGLPTKKHM